MGLITLPYSLTAHTDAKAAEVMADLNKILALVNGGIDSANIAAQGVASANIASGAVGKAQLAAGYTPKVTTGSTNLFMYQGFGETIGAATNVFHSLGEVPSHFQGRATVAENYGIVFEVRVISWDASSVRCQLIINSALPGPTELRVFAVTWVAYGQP